MSSPTALSTTTSHHIVKYPLYGYPPTAAPLFVSVALLVVLRLVTIFSWLMPPLNSTFLPPPSPSSLPLSSPSLLPPLPPPTPLPPPPPPLPPDDQRIKSYQLLYIPAPSWSFRIYCVFSCTKQIVSWIYSEFLVTNPALLNYD